MLPVLIKHLDVGFARRIDGATGPELSSFFDIGGIPQITINPEFSTNSDTAVIVVHFKDRTGKVIQSEEYTIKNSASQSGTIEPGWYKGKGCYINTYGFTQMAIEIKSITGGAIDVWTTSAPIR